MQLSHYLKIYPYEEKPGYLLLFSTKRASVLIIKEETFQAIEQGTLSPSDEALLIKHGVIVPDREEEKRDMLGLVGHEKREESDIEQYGSSQSGLQLCLPLLL